MYKEPQPTGSWWLFDGKEVTSSHDWEIQKEHHVICFGDPGYVKQWLTYGTYASRKEAEEALVKIHEVDPLSRYEIVDQRYTKWIVK